MGKIKEYIRRLIPNWIVNTFWHLPIAWGVAVWYRFPAKELSLIGVIGTDGKTTTVYLINHILKSAGYKTAMISSVAAEIDGSKSDTGFHVTSPHPVQVQKYLSDAVKKGATYAVLEVTSHALDQHRFAGCDFDYGILTNIKPDHLDYHKTFKNYLSAKVKLLKNAKTAIINKDDGSYESVVAQLAGSSNRSDTGTPHRNKFGAGQGCATATIVTYGINSDADFMPESFKLKKQPASLPGKHNLYNILAAYALALNLRDMKSSTFHKALDTFQGVPGRFEEIDTGRDFRVIIDFAHTPYALRELLTTLRAQQTVLTAGGDERLQSAKRANGGKIIVVFGCAAERGKERRKMGKVSAELADLTVITAEDPRFEDVEKISQEIEQWAIKGGAKFLDVQGSRFEVEGGKNYYIKIPDRQEAINFAIKVAEKGDIVALCGKGHEKSMNFEGVEKPWSEKKAVEHALQSLKQKSTKTQKHVNTT